MPEGAVNLEDAYEAILDAAVAKLMEQTRPGKELAGVKQVQRGDRDAAPDFPQLVLYAEPILAENAHSRMETWTLPLIVVAALEDNQPENGYRRVNRYAGAALRVLKEGRRLGLPRYVTDVQAGRLEASAPWSKRGTLFEALSVVNVIFTTY